MALQRQDGGDGLVPAADSDACRPAESETSQARSGLFLFVAAGRVSAKESAVADSAARLQEKPPEGVVVRVFRADASDAAEAALRIAREDYIGDGDHVFVIVDFDTATEAQLVAAAKVAASCYPVRGFYSTERGADEQQNFGKRVERFGGRIGQFDTHHLSKGCHLRVIHGALSSLCSC